ncbi:MAG: FAD-dependent oxidoreductase [Acidimicrobiales bacterium]
MDWRDRRHATPLGSPVVTSWDLSADVVIVGLGAAGACAALEAAAAGADTLVLEAAGAGGGTSAMSGGLLYLGGGTAVQRECGVEDSVEAMYDFLVAASGPEPDIEKIRFYCDNSLEHFEWLVDQGVPFKGEFYPEPGLESPNDAGLVFTGGEDAWPFDQVAQPAPRGHKPQVDGAAGAFLMERLVEAVAGTDVSVEFDIAVQRLVLDGEAVVGVVARRRGSELAIEARSGVVLCAGGFVNNPEMVQQHVPEIARCNYPLGSDHDRGTAIGMAQHIGASVKRMSSAEVAVPITPPRSLVRGILVNGQGQRFINEDTYYGRIGQEALFHQDGRMYLVVDEETYEPTIWGTQASWVCETVTELEEEMGLPSGSLESTLELYNRGAVDGKDPIFHKSSEFVRPLRPPLGAFDFTVENFTYATFTLGGLHTRPTGEVLSVTGDAIPGLYAAGRTTSGCAAWGYASGISLGDATLFGRHAGRRAATRA